MKKRISILLVLIMLVTIFSTACGGNDNSEANVEVKDSIVIGLEEDAVSLDPQFCSDAFGFSVMTNIYDTIFRIKEDGEVYSCLLKDWVKSEDGKTYTFNLKEGVKFHNGQELKASDIKYTLERGSESPYTADMFVCIDSVEVINDYSVEVNLKYSYDAFVSILCQPAASIVSQNLVEEGESEKNPIGTGPYKLVEWTGGDKLILSAVDDYHMGKAQIKDVEFRIIMDKSTGMIALEKGEIDAYVNISSIDRQAVIDNKDLEFYEIPSYFCFYLEFNNEVEPFNNKLVRQAISYAIDKEAIIDNAMNGIAEVADHQIPEGVFGYTDKVKSYPHDIEKAKELLTEAGYPDGFSFTLLGIEAYTKVAQVVQASLSEIGIDADIQILEFGTFIDEVFGGNSDAFIVEFGVYYPDADSILYSGYHSDCFGPLGNFPRYSNGEVDELLEKAKVSSDRNERQNLYVDILGKLHDDAPNVPLFLSTTNIACDKNLKGIYAQPQMQVFVYDFSWE